MAPYREFYMFRDIVFSSGAPSVYDGSHEPGDGHIHRAVCGEIRAATGV